jgi:hypothetical protein
MTLGGWIMMTLSVGFVTGLLAWSIYRVLRSTDTVPQEHPPADINAQDR